MKKSFLRDIVADIKGIPAVSEGEGEGLNWILATDIMTSSSAIFESWGRNMAGVWHTFDPSVLQSREISFKFTFSLLFHPSALCGLCLGLEIHPVYVCLYRECL